MTNSFYYPYISQRAWSGLVEHLKNGIPSVVDANYIKSKLSMNGNGAQRLVSALKKMGLLDDKGCPQNSLKELADETKYAQVCGNIVNKVYPDSLNSAFPDVDSCDVIAVRNWLIENNHLQETTAYKYASTYTMLRSCAQEKQTDRDLPEQISENCEKNGIQENQPIFINIPVNAQPSQIDYIMASAAKHLSGRGYSINFTLN